MFHIITFFALAALAVAAADARERRLAFAGQNQNMNVQSSSAFSGPYGNGGPGSGSGASAEASASSSSYAGSSSNGASSYSGGSPAGNAQGAGYGSKGSSYNFIPSGNPGSANYASSYPGSGSGYAGGYSGSYASNGGFPQPPSGFTPGQNLPPGCFSGFPGAGFDPFRIHQEIMNQIQRQHEQNLRFGAGLAVQAAQGGPGTQSAYASGSIGPGGGYGTAGVSPKDPGSLAVRFGDTVPDGPVHSISGNIPPTSGGSYGISTSSQSVTNVVDGVPKTYKESSVTVNDNGKVTTYKSHSP